MPNAERSPKPEFRKEDLAGAGILFHAARTGIPGFGIRISFGFRNSDFGFVFNVGV
jgi:hypothetical protein